MWYFKTKRQQIRFRLGLRPRPRKGSSQRSQTPSWPIPALGPPGLRTTYLPKYVSLNPPMPSICMPPPRTFLWPWPLTMTLKPFSAVPTHDDICAGFHRSLSTKSRLYWCLSFILNMTLTFDLWPWKPLQQRPFTWRFVPSFIEIPPYTSRHAVYVLTDNKQTDGRTDGRPSYIML